MALADPTLTDRDFKEKITRSGSSKVLIGGLTKGNGGSVVQLGDSQYRLADLFFEPIDKHSTEVFKMNPELQDKIRELIEKFVFGWGLGKFYNYDLIKKESRKQLSPIFYRKDLVDSDSENKPAMEVAADNFLNEHVFDKKVVIKFVNRLPCFDPMNVAEEFKKVHVYACTRDFFTYIKPELFLELSLVEKSSRNNP